ncbi:MAG: hypothetical protein KDD61_15310 [Bdellovibrionales bacterium]|nr:hypothetical protein [Bdellovibrionales bacterium]
MKFVCIMILVGFSIVAQAIQIGSTYEMRETADFGVVSYFNELELEARVIDFYDAYICESSLPCRYRLETTVFVENSGKEEYDSYHCKVYMNYQRSSLKVLSVNCRLNKI